MKGRRSGKRGPARRACLAPKRTKDAEDAHLEDAHLVPERERAEERKRLEAADHTAHRALHVREVLEHVLRVHRQRRRLLRAHRAQRHRERALQPRQLRREVLVAQTRH